MMHNILKVEELEYFSILSDNSQVSFVTTLPDLSFSLSSLLLWAGSSGSMDFTCALGLGVGSAFKSSVAEISPPPCSSSGLVWFGIWVICFLYSRLVVYIISLVSFFY